MASVAADGVRIRRRGRRILLPYLLIGPASLLVFAMFASLVALFVTSLTVGGGTEFSLLNYAKIVETPQYRTPFVRSAWLAIAATAVAAVLSYPVAYYMEVAGRRARRLILAFLVVVFFSDYVLRMFGLILVFGRNGLVNQAAVALGIVDAPMRLMFNELGVFFGLVSGSLPFTILVLNGVIARIDFSLVAAARLLGAGPFRVFLHILLPLSMPGLIAGSTIVFLLSLNSLITPALLGGGFVDGVANFVYDQAINLFNLPLGAAAAMILFVIATALMLGINAWFERRGRQFGFR